MKVFPPQEPAAARCRATRWIFVSIAILIGFSDRCGDATVYNSDGSAASVQGLANAALNGDTITLPRGTFSWATGVTITKMITLQGQGTGTGGGDQTVIIDNYASGQPLLNFQARLDWCSFA